MEHASQQPIVTRLDFSNDDDFFTYFLTKKTPRFSFYVGHDEKEELTMIALANMGAKAGEALFSDDLVALQKTVWNWDENQYRVELVMAVEPEGPDDRCWELAAGPNVPEWFVRQFCSFRTAITAPYEEVEREALYSLCTGGMVIWDKQKKSHRDNLRNSV